MRNIRKDINIYGEGVMLTLKYNYGTECLDIVYDEADNV